MRKGGTGLLQQVAAPVLADELSVCSQAGKLSLSKALQKLVEQLQAFIGVGITLFVEEAPSHWKGDPFMYHTEHQDVEDTIAKAPLGSIQREHPRLRHCHQAQQCFCDFGIIHLNSGGRSAGGVCKASQFGRCH